MRTLSKILATLWIIGKSPIAPGTVASLLGVGLYLVVYKSIFAYLSVTIFLLVVGFISSIHAERFFSERDPHAIVIYEFSSMLIVYLFLPFSIGIIILGFFLFRLFDIVKPPPIRKLESLPGGYGIMLDDIASAILTNLILRIVILSGISI
jgi:phosphatidylglycerophosphatase A